MAQIINPNPSGLSLLGQSLGQGLSRGIDNLIQKKMLQLQQQRQAQGLQSILGSSITPEQAQSIAQLSPEIQKEYIKNLLAAPQQQEFARGIQALLGQPEQAPIEQQVQQLEQMQPQSVPSKSSVDVGRLTEKQAGTLGKLALQKQALEKREEGKIKKEELKETQRLRKESRDFLSDLQTKYDVAKFSDARLSKMESLIDKGGLPISSFYSLFKNLEEHTNPAYAAAAGSAAGGRFGLPGAVIGGAIGGLISPIASLLRGAQKFTSPNTEEFEKLSADFVKDAKGLFGSRLTDQDLKAFLQTVPTLSQTDAGKKKIIHNMKAMNEASKIKYKAAKQIIKENDGVVPPNLNILVEERSKDALDKWAAEFSV